MNGNHSSGPSKTLLEIVPCGVGMRTKNASVPPELERMRELGGPKRYTPGGADQHNVTMRL
jgi:hypothetical protein